MKGKDRFTRSEADEIRRLLKVVRRAEPGSAQKGLRAKLRALGFYISDFAAGAAGFTASDFGDLVRRGRIQITGSTTGGQRVAGRDGRPTILPPPRDTRPGPRRHAARLRTGAAGTA